MVRFVEDGGDDAAPGEQLAPVIPLFGRAGRDATASRERSAPDWHRSWVDAPAHAAPTAERRVSRGPTEADSETTGDGVDDGVRERAEKALLKKLRTRSLSVSEARKVLLQHAVDAADADALIAEFERVGYLDDADLAAQVMYAAVERKGQGRRVIAQTLQGRGIPRDVVDAALAELPDDDAERALEFARQKARSMGSLDRDAALRRLHGQLARRGFPGSVAMTAARTALEEQISGSAVRFR